MNFIIENICKKYGKKCILNGISFEIRSGECIGLIGANGSGKSTLLSILAGIQNADDGRFMLDGSHIDSHAIGYAPQGTPLFEELSARDNLMLWYSRSEIINSLANGVLNRLGINEFIDMRVSKLSGGMKKKLSIACSVAGHPKILLLDEPCASLDLSTRKSISEYIDAYKKSGGAIIIATHDDSEISWCDKLYILKDGVVHKYDGDVSGLADML